MEARRAIMPPIYSAGAGEERSHSEGRDDDRLFGPALITLAARALAPLHVYDAHTAKDSLYLQPALI